MIALLAQEEGRWALAGDQLFIDLDLGASNLPPGTQLAIGSAVVEVTPPPHNGCKKFAARFGEEAVKFMSLPENKEMYLRGINVKVVQPGVIHVGGHVSKRQRDMGNSSPIGI
jgi:MOSC domain-containing protein YiiM